MSIVTVPHVGAIGWGSPAGVDPRRQPGASRQCWGPTGPDHGTAMRNPHINLK